MWQTHLIVQPDSNLWVQEQAPGGYSKEPKRSSDVANAATVQNAQAQQTVR